MLATAVAAYPGAAAAQSRPASPDPRPAPHVLDDFERPAQWSAHASDGVTLELTSDPAGVRGRALRLDFDFHGGGGYAIARRTLDLELPANYAFTLFVRGDARPQNIEFKLLADSAGENVWWSNMRDFSFPRRWTQVTRKRRHIEFAWGPMGGGELRRVAALEISITAGQGGKGTVWLDELGLTPLEPVVAGADAAPPRPTASSSAAGQGAELATDGDTATAWRSGAGNAAQWLALDFGRQREFGGLVIDWDRTDYATDYAVEASAEGGARWEELRRITGGDGGRDYVDVPEGEARRLRLRLLRPAPGARGYAVRDVSVRPLAFAATPNDFARAVARDARRGIYPRYVTDSVQAYWTLVGVSGDYHEGLLGEDGALESGRAAYSIEPFLRLGAGGDTLVGWADVEATPTLERGYLPIPSVEWTRGDVAMTITAFATGSANASTLWARYRVINRGTTRRPATLYLTVRPFQVNPTWQFLNKPGGVATVRSVRWDGAVVRVDSARPVVPLTRPTTFGASSFDQGEIVEAIRRGALPRRTSVRDERGRAAAALAFALDLPAGATRDVWVELPPASARAGARAAPNAARGTGRGEAALASSVREWDERLNRVRVDLPAAGAAKGSDVAATLRTTLAYILINRQGPAIQPGSRSYSRSWIRDGALTSAAMLRLGQPEAVKQFIEWFAPFQYPSGKVPCCVDARGADPVPEHDSHGELIFLIAEYYRYTHDRALLERMWPHVAAAAAYIDSLRQQRRTAEYRTPEKRAYFGLMPQSISHEGYSAKPMHSYWDQFFGLKGLKDATDLAAALGREGDRARLAAIRDEFRRDLYASLDAVITTRKIDFIPGSVELADFDATSTTTAIEPGGEMERLPAGPLRSGFARYYAGVMARRDSVWEGYTPYELRTVGTFVRMGDRQRAHDLLAAFMGDRRPPAWNQWAEVVFRDPKTPKFIGDMPHTWVGSDFIRSTLDMFAFDREADSALVVGAGVPEAWASSGDGVVVRAIRTPFGPLDLSIRSGGDSATVTVGGGGMRVPPGGVVVRSPRSAAPRKATVDGAPARLTAAGDSMEVLVRRLPAVVVFRF